MEEIIKVSILAIISCILALLIKEKTSYFGICITIISGVLILGATLLTLSELLSDIKSFVNLSSIDFEVFLPVIKVCGISVIVKIACDICKDAGFSAVASKILFAGSVASLITIFPLFLRIASILEEII